MLRVTCPALIAVPLVAFTLGLSGAAAADPSMETKSTNVFQRLELSPLAQSSTEGVTGVAWIGEGSAIRMAVSFAAETGDILRAFNVSENGSAATATETPLPASMGRPQWTGYARGDGTAGLALTRPGSAICGLDWTERLGEAPAAITSEFPRGIFTSPRFVRAATESPPPVSTIEVAKGTQCVSLFSLDPDRRSVWTYKQLASTHWGLPQAAVGVHVGDGYLLFIKALEASRTNRFGEPPRLPHPALVSVGAGILYCQRLDREFKPVGDLFRPLGDEAIYEFDADAHHQAVAVAATQRDGLLVAEFLWGQHGLIEASRERGHPDYDETKRWEEQKLPPLVLPAVARSATGVCLALLENDADRPRVLWRRR